MILKSHIFRPPSFFFPIMVFLLILGGFPAQIKLKISLFFLEYSDLEQGARRLSELI